MDRLCAATAAQFQSIYDRFDTSAAAFGSSDAQRRNSSQLDDICRTADDVQLLQDEVAGWKDEKEKGFRVALVAYCC